MSNLDGGIVINNKITNKEHLIYHFKSFLEEFSRIDCFNKSLIIEHIQILTELLSEGLDIPYPILLKYLYGGNNDAKTDEKS